MSGHKLPEVKKSRELYLMVSNMAKKIENNKKYGIIKEIELAAKDPTKVDLSDINEIVEMHEEGGKLMDNIHIEFKQYDHSDNNVKMKQRWKIKLNDRSFWIYRIPKGTTCETGVWNKELFAISQGKKSAKYNIKAIERATHILDVRGYKPTIKKGDVGQTKDCGLSLQEGFTSLHP